MSIMSGVEQELEEGEIRDSDTSEEEQNPQEIKKQPAWRYTMVSNAPVTTATSKNIFSPPCSGSDESDGNKFLDEGVKKRKLQFGWMDCKPRVRLINTDFENNESKMFPQPNQSNRVYWAPVLSDQIRTSGVGRFSMAEKLSSHKRIKSGDYSRANEDDRPFLGDEVKPGKRSLLGKWMDLEKPAFQQKTTLKRKSVSEQLGKRSSVKEGLHLPNVTESSSVEDVTYYISTKLQETKVNLIRRAVQVLGQAKALHVLKKTETIENNGGMMTMDGSRRRTPGGVYLWLLKTDEVSKEQRENIFEGEKPWKQERNMYMKDNTYQYKYKWENPNQVNKKSKSTAGKSNENKTTFVEAAKYNSSHSNVKGETGSTTDRDKHLSISEEGFVMVKIDRGRSDFKEGEREKSEHDDFSQLAHEVKAAEQKAKEKPVADGGDANAISLDDVLELDLDDDFLDNILR